MVCIPQMFRKFKIPFKPHIFVPPDFGARELATALEASRLAVFSLGIIHQVKRAHVNPHVRLRDTHGEVQRVQRVQRMQRQRAAGSPHGWPNSSGNPNGLKRFEFVEKNDIDWRDLNLFKMGWSSLEIKRFELVVARFTCGTKTTIVY